MSAFFYYLMTFAESITSVVGLRFPYEQPHYIVLQHLSEAVEIRKYDPRTAIEATVDAPTRDQAASEAFGLLFRYITGANRGSEKIAMTAPVQTDPQRIAMTVPVQTSSDGGAVSMRFFLPKSVVETGAPAPLDPRLHLVDVPATTVAALRYSGVADADTAAAKTRVLLGVLAKSSWKPDGTPFLLNYDPPFTIPFLRRNEVAVPVTRSTQPSP